MKYDLTLAKINNTDFCQIYKRFIVGCKLTEREYETILAIAVCFINAEDRYVQQFGYRIIVDYCNQTEDYKPLYEISVNIGLYPIAKYIETHCGLDNYGNFFTEWNGSFMETYNDNGIYQSEQQKAMVEFSSEYTDKSVTIVAPTSYGKSELINNIVKDFPGNKICILVPTKALIMQTKKRINLSENKRFKKIIVHPEMYNSNEDVCLAVLTQERLLRMFKCDQTLAFDCIVIDEAHELLEKESRSRILADVIIIAQKRNPGVALKFLTPFISDPNNLKVRYTAYNLEPFKVNEYIKSEKYYIHDLKNNENLFYDQFIDESFKIKDLKRRLNEAQIVKAEGDKKNIIYLNKPQDIERFAIDLSDILPEANSDIINDACKDISDYTQPQYNLIKCLRKGVIYHHGSVPDAIRIYIEELYKKEPAIKYVVTSSTLLAGVNLPADRMFILDNRRGRSNLSPESFRNLVGRVCRFSEIFGNQDHALRLLEPQIHIVFGEYFSPKSNIQKFMSKVAKVNAHLEDSVENVLLQKSDINEPLQKEELKNATEFIENFENGSVIDYQQRYIKTEVGQSCIKNGINEIDVFETEKQMQSMVELYKQNNYIISDVDSLLIAIWDIFLQYLPDKGQYELKRLGDSTVREFYSRFLNWRIENKSYGEMTKLCYDYWKQLSQKNHYTNIYVGRWGDIPNEDTHKNQFIRFYNKTHTQIINIAIVRVKEEQDFIDNSLIKYIEVLEDLNLLEEQFYLKIKYGTDDDDTICLLKNGLSLNLSILLLEKYRHFLRIDVKSSLLHIDDQLPNVMSNNQENQILIQELLSCM